MAKTSENSCIRFGNIIKPLIEQVATSLGVSQSVYVRYIVRQDLKKRGLLNETNTHGMN